MADTLVERTAPRLIVSPGTPLDIHARQRSNSNLDVFSPVNNDGCFEFDRVLKSGYVQKRTQKTKKWKSVYLVLRSNTLSMYKTDKEDRLRHQLYLADLTAVADLKDPKHKRQNVFGLFSPSRNWHFEAPTAKDAQEWVQLIRRDARIEEEEDEMLLASPRESGPSVATRVPALADSERFLSSSPEPLTTPLPKFTPGGRRRSSLLESSGLSGAELGSHSDFSDNETARVHDPSIESLAVQIPALNSSRPSGIGMRSASQTSVSNIDQDPDRVIWQGWLWFLRTRRGVRQWKNRWAVLRPRNLILYKDELEYKAQWILPLSNVVNAVDIDAIGKKNHCLQVITEEKTYRFCAHDEESLVQCLGAFASLFAKRRELEARAAAI
ncbi:hypothetical protein B0T10DRAFT_316297 [Thelonectria olida]|uniref:PH domain-containing protein n=1 Tax=Thelonectria olida TaxID=1576542 RepID=A0A9P8W4T2_9HYPO|nr:hypothetical protein B0T10DRAFT_316297 [Thelonectria olida]